LTKTKKNDLNVEDILKANTNTYQNNEDKKNNISTEAKKKKKKLDK